MNPNRKIELLAPARTAEIGIEAIRHGADAVYIGAPSFSARVAAGNSVADIERLASYAHQYGAKTIIALNTILTDQELNEAEKLTWQLYEAGVDALIVQDYGLLGLHLPPVELHASTQTDNRSIEKVRLLRRMGFTRVVMARELSVDEIRAIHEAVPDVELECFVHGALCVCVSGRCYLSAALTGRSANRGACAQPCRLPMDLLSDDGRTVLARQRHLLSLCDMNRSAHLGQLLDAGVSSLKIEGRLKDMAYVKNVVAYYRQALDRALEGRDDLEPVSRGRCTYTFTPELAKSFNRGFTTYFAEGKREPMWNFDSPKSMGEYVGRITRVVRDFFEADTSALRGDDALHNGDGLVAGSLGFRLNRYDAATGRCYPLDGGKACSQLRVGGELWRNADLVFEQKLTKPSAQRVMPVDMAYKATENGLELRLSMSQEITVTVSRDTEPGELQPAERPQRENIVKQLSKLGGTFFELGQCAVEGDNWFVPSSKIAELRRQGVEKLLEAYQKMQTELRTSFHAPDYLKLASETDAKDVLPTTFEANVLNGKSREILRLLGLENVDDAFEIQSSKEGMVMQTRHCLKYAFGQCPRYHNPKPEKLLDSSYKIGSEMQLKIGNRKFILKFGCKNDCYSKIFTIFAPSFNSTK